MSAFAPQDYAEAKLTFKPLRRSPIRRKVGILGSRGNGTVQRDSGAKKRATRKAKRAKKPTDGQLKKRAWKEFSIFIRTEGADENGFNGCVTCPVRQHWKEMQAGHFIRGRLNANLFDERGCHPQCYGCNVGRQGNVVIYYKFMLEKYGQKVIDELILQNNKTKKWQGGELQAKLEYYRAKNDANPLVERKAKRSPRADGNGTKLEAGTVVNTSAQTDPLSVN